MTSTERRSRQGMNGDGREMERRYRDSKNRGAVVLLSCYRIQDVET